MIVDRRSIAVHVAVVCMCLAVVASIAGCSSSGGGTSAGESEESASGEKTETPKGYSSFVVTINDSDSFTEGDITYTIDLALTAANPTQDMAGAYSGSATAKTSTVGTVQGLPLTASADVNSQVLEFTLEEGFDSEGGALAPLTEEGLVYSGTGTIVMAASGSGNVGGAAGVFSNTSGQNLQVSVQGSAVTMKVDIGGHTYTFEGTIAGQ